MSDARIADRLAKKRLETFLEAPKGEETSKTLAAFLSRHPISQEEKVNYRFVGPAGEDYMSERWEIRRHLLSDYAPLSGLPSTIQVSQLAETNLVKKALDDAKYTPSTAEEAQKFINQLKNEFYPSLTMTHEKALQLCNVMHGIAMTTIPASLKEWIKSQLFEHPNKDLFLAALNDRTKIDAEFAAYKEYLRKHNGDTAEELKSLERDEYAPTLFFAQCQHVYTAAIHLCVVPELKEDHSELPTKLKNNVSLGKPEFTILAAVCIRLEERITSGQLKHHEEMLLNLKRMVEKFEKKAGVNTTYMRKQPTTSNTAPPVTSQSTSTITLGRRS